MNRRFRNIILFLASIFGTFLLVVGVTSLANGDSSGWRAVIGAVFAFALVVVTLFRAHATARHNSPL